MSVGTDLDARLDLQAAQLAHQGARIMQLEARLEALTYKVDALQLLMVAPPPVPATRRYFDPASFDGIG